MPNDGDPFGDEEGFAHDKDAPAHFSLVAIDEHVVPSLKCPDGHIIQWKNPETGTTLTYLQLVDIENQSINSICMVCGQKPVEVTTDGQSEG